MVQISVIIYIERYFDFAYDHTYYSYDINWCNLKKNSLTPIVPLLQIASDNRCANIKK